MSAAPKSRAERVIAMAAAIGEIAVVRLKGPSRKQDVIELRAGCVLVLREGGLSYPTIARLLNRGDHSTVIHAHRKAERLLASDPEFAWLIDALRAAARAGRAELLAAPPVRADVVARFVPAAIPVQAGRHSDEGCDCGECAFEAREAARQARGCDRLAAAIGALRFDPSTTCGGPTSRSGAV